MTPMYFTVANYPVYFAQPVHDNAQVSSQCVTQDLKITYNSQRRTKQQISSLTAMNKHQHIWPANGEPTAQSASVSHLLTLTVPICHTVNKM